LYFLFLFFFPSLFQAQITRNSPFLQLSPSKARGLTNFASFFFFPFPYLKVIVSSLPSFFSWIRPFAPFDLGPSLSLFFEGGLFCLRDEESELLASPPFKKYREGSAPKNPPFPFFRGFSSLRIVYSSALPFLWAGQLFFSQAFLFPRGRTEMLIEVFFFPLPFSPIWTDDFSLSFLEQPSELLCVPAR